MKQHGFSLVEVLVALFIVAFLGLAAGQSVFSALRSESRGDAARRVAAQIMQASAQPMAEALTAEVNQHGLQYFSDQVDADQLEDNGEWLVHRWRDRASGLTVVSARHRSTPDE